MTNSACGTWRAAAKAFVLLALLALGVAPASAEAGPSAPAAFELSRSVQQSLARMQELWLQWVGASLQDNRARADEALRGLVSSVREVGFSHLPDLALGAAAQARQSARDGEFERARRQLEAAEEMDPRRPETAFAAAAVARAQGDWFAMAASTIRGLLLTRQVEAGAQARSSLLYWCAFVVQLASALFVALLALVRAPGLVQALRERLSPPLPPVVASGLVAVVLLAPAALPWGLFWLLLLWSALLWTFATRSERIVLLICWLLTALVPIGLGRWTRDLTLDLSPPMRAVSAFERGRLYGGFFSDLQVLRTALPDRPVVLELMGDVHRTLGQWELARSHYRRALVDEGENVSALLNVGSYHFRKGDYAIANDYFKRAARPVPTSAAAYFNLSVGYSAAYLFEESRDALAKAREIDASAVDRWISTENPDRVLTSNGSLARKDEIRRLLLGAWSEDSTDAPRAALASWLGSVAPSVAAALLALLLELWLRPMAKRERPPLRLGPERLARSLRSTLRALPAAESGAGFVSWGHLLLLVSLAALPWAFDLAGDLQLPGWPGPQLLAIFSVVALLGYVAAGLRAGLRGTEE